MSFGRALHVLVCLSIWIGKASGTAHLTAYSNDFVNPDYILAGHFQKHTQPAQDSIVAWAKELARSGPWSVTQKPVTPPSGDKHDYLSWAPYWWPDCAEIGNSTALTDEQVWTKCPYKQRDGQYNPDRILVNDIGRFQNMSEAVLYNTIAWTLNITDKATFESNAVNFLRTWFLDSKTKMNANLDYGQMHRGPKGQKGSHTGLLDLKGMAKVATGVLILRKGESTLWTSDLDNGLSDWCQEYIDWMESSDLAVEEGHAENNHGTFYYNQLAALKILVDDLEGAKAVTNMYFNNQFLQQIDKKGEQPLEAARTHPYHYRNYNLAAMITNARLASYLDPESEPFKLTTKAGSTIKSAVDFAMTTSADANGEKRFTNEIFPNIATVASVYGDPTGKYLAFMREKYPGFMEEPFVLWNQPWAQGEFYRLGRGNGTESSANRMDAMENGVSRLFPSQRTAFILFTAVALLLL